MSGGRRDGGEPSRVHRVWLWLYPPRHRREYGEEMWAVVRHRWRGGRGQWRHVVTVLDLVGSAARIWASLFVRGCAATFAGAWLDVRFARRGMRSAPGFAVIAALLLATAVAVNVAALAFLRGTLFAVPPYAEPGRVVVAWGSNPVNGQVRDVVSGSNFIDLALGTRTLQSLAAVHPDDAVLMRDGRPEVIGALEVSVDFLDVLGVVPRLGRDFGEAERYGGGPATVLVSHVFWRDRLGGDATVVGRTIVLDGVPHTVLGVLPETFRFALSAPLLLPLHDDALAAESRTHHHYWLFGRLRDGATPGEASAELSAVMRRLAAEAPGLTGWSVLVEPVDEVTVESVRGVLWSLTCAVGLVLLVAVVNLATLYRLRMLGRVDELALRAALGSSVGRTARVVLLEPLLLGLAGGVMGLGGGALLLRFLEGRVPQALPIPGSAAVVPSLRASLDPVIATAAMGLALVASLLLALPSLRTALVLATRRRVAGARPGAVPALRLLVGAELALATVLCLAAALSTRSVLKLLRTDVGIETDGLLTLYAGDVGERTVADRAAYFASIVDRVTQLPAVMRAGVIDYAPFQGEDDFEGVRFAGRPVPAPGQGVREEWRRVSEGLFEAAGVRVLDGRAFVVQDYVVAPRVAVVNRAFVRKHYPDGPVLGEHISLSPAVYRDLEIVGIVDDVYERGPAVAAPPMVYVPYHAAPRGNMALFVRVRGDPLADLDPIREAIWSVDPGQPIDRVAIDQRAHRLRWGWPAWSLTPCVCAGASWASAWHSAHRRPASAATCSRDSCPRSVRGSSRGSRLAWQRDG